MARPSAEEHDRSRQARSVGNPYLDDTNKQGAIACTNTSFGDTGRQPRGGGRPGGLGRSAKTAGPLGLVFCPIGNKIRTTPLRTPTTSPTSPPRRTSSHCTLTRTPAPTTTTAPPSATQQPAPALQCRQGRRSAAAYHASTPAPARIALWSHQMAGRRAVDAVGGHGLPKMVVPSG